MPLADTMADEKLSLRNAFEQIYSSGGWVRSGSGPGSSSANTIEYRAFVSRFIEANGIRTITDLGCGDWQFSRFLDWSGLEYLGLDVVPEIVENNRNLFGQANVQFEMFISPDALPGGDLLLSKEVLQHLPNSTIIEYLNAIRRKYRFALLTNTIVPISHVNVDINLGGYRPLRLQNPPFSITGAVVFTYFPESANLCWKNAVFLMMGGDDRS
jgi:hypothetical protein